MSDVSWILSGMGIAVAIICWFVSRSEARLDADIKEIGARTDIAMTRIDGAMSRIDSLHGIIIEMLRDKKHERDT